MHSKFRALGNLVPLLALIAGCATGGSASTRSGGDIPASSPYAHLAAPSEDGDDAVPAVKSELVPVKGEDDPPSAEAVAPTEAAPIEIPAATE